MIIEQIQPNDLQDWRQWLSQNYSTSKGVWLVSFKKETGKPFIPYEQAVEQALCFGWIDSKPNKLDSQRHMLYYAPRNPKSNWSAINKARVKTMIDAGLMHESGIKMVELAKQTGTWDALNDVENLIIPADLQTQLDQNPLAKQNFMAFPRSVKRGILEWILNAKQPETRAKRILETTQKAQENIRANQYKKK